MRRTLAMLSVCLAVLVATDARATCNPGQSPFNDVADGDIFCGSALWLRNALVTAGCPGVAVYCPDLPVTRAQMALFMKRLANAVLPDMVYSATPSAPGDVDGDGFATCVTSTYTIPAASNPRTLAQGIGTVSILTNGAAELFVMIQMSTNGGLFGTLGVNPPLALVPGSQWTVVPVISGQTVTGGAGPLLAPGSTYQWRILLQRSGGSTTGEVTDNRCQLMIGLPVYAAP